MQKTKRQLLADALSGKLSIKDLIAKTGKQLKEHKVKMIKSEFREGDKLIRNYINGSVEILTLEELEEEKNDKNTKFITLDLSKG